MPSYDTNVGAKRAREARIDLGLDPARPLECLLTVVEERAGIPVVVAAMGPDVAGCLWQDGAHRLVHVNGEQAVVRQRFTLAHELGHACCGHDGRAVVDTVATISGRTTDPREIQANAFAAELLVPREALDEVLDGEPNLDELVVLAAFFGVSAAVALYRCVTCGFVGDERKTRLEAEIEEGEHLVRLRELRPHVVRDTLADAAGHLPYLSPAIRDSALGASLRPPAPR